MVNEPTNDPTEPVTPAPEAPETPEVETPETPETPPVVSEPEVVKPGKERESDLNTFRQPWQDTQDAADKAEKKSVIKKAKK